MHPYQRSFSRSSFYSWSCVTQGIAKRAVPSFNPTKMAKAVALLCTLALFVHRAAAISGIATSYAGENRRGGREPLGTQALLVWRRHWLLASTLLLHPSKTREQSWKATDCIQARNLGLGAAQSLVGHPMAGGLSDWEATPAQSDVTERHRNHLEVV